MARWGDLELPGETPARQDPAHHPLPPQADPPSRGVHANFPGANAAPKQAGQAARASWSTQAAVGGQGTEPQSFPTAWGGGDDDNTSDLGGLSVTLTPRRRQLAGGQPARRLPVSLSSSGGVPQELQTDVGPGPPHQGPPPPPRPPPTKGLLSFGAGSPPGCRTGAPGEGQRAGGEPGVCRVSSFLQQPPPPLVLFNHFLFFFLLLLFAFLFYFSLLIFIF